jgi:hypothetical protein
MTLGRSLILLAQNRQDNRDQVASSRTGSAASVPWPTPSTYPASSSRSGSP